MNSISTPALAHMAQHIGAVDTVLVDDDAYLLQVGNRHLRLSEHETRTLLRQLIAAQVANDAESQILA